MFQTKAASEIEFTNLNELHAWVAKEENSISRIPVSGMLDNGSTFFDDEGFGSSDFKLAFTEEGLRALCYKLGFPALMFCRQAIQGCIQFTTSSQRVNV